MPHSTTAAFAAVFSVLATVCCGTEFDDLLRSPSRYDGRAVSIVGLAEVNGGDFDLWPSLRDRKREDFKRAISVMWDTTLPNYPPGTNISHYTYLSYRWVRAAGIVNTSFRGRHGMRALGLRLQDVRVLPGRRQKQFLRDIAVFHNATSHLVKVRLTDRRGHEETDISGIEPKGSEDTELVDDFAVVTSSSDSFIARCNVSRTRASRRYYDSDKHAYYYQVTDGDIRLVMPSEAKKWNLYWLVDRD
jgi:hypothetical protein